MIIGNLLMKRRVIIKQLILEKNLQRSFLIYLIGVQQLTLVHALVVIQGAVQVSGFQHIHAFEMDSNFITSFAKNIALSNVSFYNFPVYSHETNMTVHGKFILNPISGETTAYAIDQFMFDDVDFIKIDCDGPDRLVLQGCLETIKRCKPVIHIEGGNLQIQRDNNVNKPLDIFQSVLDLNIGYDAVIGTGHNPMHILFPRT